MVVSPYDQEVPPLLPSLSLRSRGRNDKSSSVMRREIGRPPGNLAIEEYAYGRPISLHFTPAIVIPKKGPRSSNEGGPTEESPDPKGGALVKRCHW
ncbi:MAG: hypothetical protein IH594_09860 [Bacteroidales bacterium]|nr:hypothetical protein [Bacteroidales bacterium]